VARSAKSTGWAFCDVASGDAAANIVAEDAAFFGHEGIDVNEIRKSLETDIARGEFTRGASTITQQLAKNLYLSPSLNPLRKLREFLIARRLEAELTKSRIFELYLNEIEWGDGIYGVEAASRTYFGVPASAIGPDQAALLAGAIVNPRVLNPLQPNGRLRARQRLIRARMGNVTPPPVLAAGPERPASDAAELLETLAPVEPVDETPVDELQPSRENPADPAVQPQPAEPASQPTPPTEPVPQPFPRP
jgi:monofunctional biosynthetic peptidoglycan transglycosylase